MFSILRPSLLYTDISPDIAEHDEDHDASEWAYSERTVFRGALDGSYKNDGLDVYWLYDDDLNRVGLAEHESEDHSMIRHLAPCFKRIGKQRNLSLHSCHPKLIRIV